MIKKYIGKVKNYYNKKVIITGAIVLFTLCFFMFDLGGLLSRVLTNVGNLFSNVDGEIKQVVIKSDGYDEGVGGSIQITKSADWTSNDSAMLVYDVNTNAMIDEKSKDIVIVLDTSISNSGNKLEKVQADIIEVISMLLNNDNNRIGIITFNETSEILLPLTNDKNSLINSINNLTIGGKRNYYKSLLKLEEFLDEYIKSDDNELIVLFITTGFPQIDTPNEMGQYNVIKEKYPSSMVYGISYEAGKEITTSLNKISDEQIILDYSKNVLLEPALNPKYYDSFEMVEYIDNDYFYIDDVDDIKVSFGEVTLTNENNKQKIIWSISNNKFRTNQTVTMNINLKLNDNLVGVEDLYQILSGSNVNYMLDGSSYSIENDETPILKNGYKVEYNANAPDGCQLDFELEETHYAYAEVFLSTENLQCNGWKFQGWKVADSVNIINDEIFIMPSNDVVVRGNWTKLELNKTMEGSVNQSIQTNFVYEYTGAPQTFKAPYTGKYKIELWGAQGGTGKVEDYDDSSSTPFGGLGAYTLGEISLISGTELYIYVGGKGGDAITVKTLANAGYNGGGIGAIGGNDNDASGAGGGATDVRLVNGDWNNFDSLKSRIMVAAGGGGSASVHTSENNLKTDAIIGGGLEVIGKVSTWESNWTPKVNQVLGNKFGIGKSGIEETHAAAGGGGGYYGGSNKIIDRFGGIASGGSSFISGHNGCDAIKETSTSKKIVHTGQSIHYSGYQFLNTIMIDGAGYKWTTARESYVGMPTHDGTSTMTGNKGNGYAKITFLG